MVCGLILALMTSKYPKAMSAKDGLIFRFVDLRVGYYCIMLLNIQVFNPKNKHFTLDCLCLV